MSLVPLREILKEAEEGNYAVGYFESWDYGSLEATVRTAEELNFPVIAGFGARTFVSERGWDERKLICFARMGREMIQRSSVPISFLLNESHDLLMLRKGMEAGFNCVMFDGGDLSFEDNTKLTKKVVEEAKRWKVDVEAQLGKIPSPGENLNDFHLTSPQEARIFVEKTGVVALAVSVGNVHMSKNREVSIDLIRLEKIRKSSNIPLVMHGGTGFPDELIPEVVKRGVYKFNLGSILKEIFLRELKEGLLGEELEKDSLALIHDLVDSQGGKGIFKKAYFAVKEVIKEKIRLYSLKKERE
jgi:ketose-bisphosphate aldolase